ncbi:hypothetical protein COV11_03410 [Candidatus Woesearchaeota archaeon CG10_big_fil_rev_8_21_14_0_10_30_7]|nr:MAG: hypothetical protein COV11_03410 [Candidatus Woesearchaeota archaeon CG10_big_fil_rev_8_21_14_0_10_30_7]
MKTKPKNILQRQNIIWWVSLDLMRLGFLTGQCLPVFTVFIIVFSQLQPSLAMNQEIKLALFR